MAKYNLESQLSNRLFYQQEYNIYHLPYKTELTFYEAVKEGDIETIKKIMLPLDSDQLGKLSPNPVRNMQYHLVVTIAFITRFCMEGGMNEEEAYTLSDLNIQKIDACNDTKTLTQMHRDIIFDYAYRMQKINQRQVFSLPVIQCIDYIHSNLHQKISLSDLSEHCKKNPTYLCELFKKEVGTTIASYIRDKKIEAAANMLKFSDHTSVDIANYFGFCSHSQFINTFKKATGMTPRQYRNAHFSKNWDNNSDFSG